MWALSLDRSFDDAANKKLRLTPQVPIQLPTTKLREVVEDEDNWKVPSTFLVIFLLDGKIDVSVPDKRLNLQVMFSLDRILNLSTKMSQVLIGWDFTSVKSPIDIKPILHFLTFKIGSIRFRDPDPKFRPRSASKVKRHI